MTHAELLRSHANLAIKEGGMYYSGEYLSRIATVAESLEAENAQLRELVRDFDKCLDTTLYLADSAGYLTMPDQKLFASLRQRMRELGVETDR